MLKSKEKVKKSSLIVVFALTYYFVNTFKSIVLISKCYFVLFQKVLTKQPNHNNNIFLKVKRTTKSPTLKKEK